MLYDSVISPHLYIVTRGQRSRVCEKLFCRVSSRWWSRGVHRDPNAITAQRVVRFFFLSNTCQKMQGSKGNGQKPAVIAKGAPQLLQRSWYSGTSIEPFLLYVNIQSSQFLSAVFHNGPAHSLRVLSFAAYYIRK